MNNFFYFWQLCLLCFIVSSCKDTDEQPSQHTLVGKWYFVTTQEKENNQWFDFPMPLDGAEMFIEFLPDHSATIVRTVGDQVDSKNFTWELMPDGSFIVNGETEGRLDFSGNNRFYWQTTTTNDSFTGKVLEGLFRDVYDRNPAPADKPGVITERPQGKIYHFSMEGRNHYYRLGMGSNLSFYGKTVEAVEGEEGVLYLKNLLPNLGLPDDYYVKAVMDNDRILVPLPQVISTKGKLIKYLWRGVKQYNSGDEPVNFISNLDKRFITFMKDEKGIFQLVEDIDQLSIGLCDVHGNWMGKHLEPTVAYAISEMKLKPANIDLVTPPAGLPVQNFVFKGVVGADKIEIMYTGKMIQQGQEVYLQGLGQVLPDAWVKGVLHSAGDQPYLAIPSEQYLGESKGMAWYFYGDRVEEKLHEPTGTLRLKHHLFEAGDSLRFNYNPQQRTLTTRSDEGFVCNAGTIDEYMTSELREVSITLTDETVFTAPLLMGDVEIPAIFQVTDAEKKLCQVGSGIIKESGEDIFYGTAVMSIVFGKLEIPAEVNGYQVEAVGPGAFGDCKHLTEVVLPASVTRIGDWAFMNTGLTTMRLPQLTHLGEGALSGCDQLTEIEIPGSLKKVDQFAFSESEYLEKVVIQSGVTEISRCAFAFCYRLQTLEWQSPATVKKIGSLAFKCTDFTSVTLPASLTMIGEGAFSVCNSLQKVVCEAEVPPTIVEVRDAEYIFDGLPDDATLHVPQGSVEAYSQAPGWNVFLKLGGIHPIAQ